MSTLEERARALATRAHGAIDHRRKYTGEPYIAHPAEVAEIVRGVPHSEEMIAAAWLHDVLEDTPTPEQEIEDACGPEVLAMVRQLSDVSKPGDGNRGVRKALDREHVRLAWPRTKTVKLADLISNTRSIVVNDPAFAKVYLREKRELLEVLKEGDARLWRIAAEQSGLYCHPL